MIIRFDREWALIGLSLIILLTSCGPAIPTEVELALDNLPSQVDYNIQVKPILSDRCFACHGPDEAKREAGMRLDIESSAKGDLPDSPGSYAIVPGKPGKSKVVSRILSEDEEVKMPPPSSNLSLSSEEKAVLIKWIEQGAEYRPHWAFEAPIQPKIPHAESDWAVNEIDRFIEAKMKGADLSPGLRSPQDMLIRRLSFDLTGLPPSLEMLERIDHHGDEGSYEAVVDELLSSPHFGEHMAASWLDLARYADTHGYTVDRYRDMSPWRDWVINAINENMPYDQFVTWQLAGDMLPQASREQIIASGFNRNHPQNMEGGIIDEEFRVEYVADRTNTFGTAFLGLTMGCARCHDHKYDPISQAEYYQLFAFFNNINEAGQIDFSNAMPVPTLLLTTERIDSITHYIDQELAKQGRELESITAVHESLVKEWWNQSAHNLQHRQWPVGLQAHFSCDSRLLIDRLHRGRNGEIKQQFIRDQMHPTIVPGRTGSGVKLDGDAWINLGDAGVFDRYQPFSIGMWIYLPQDLENGVIFHKGEGAALYNFRGYHMALKDNKLEILLSHTTPNNAIIKLAPNPPREQWIHILMTYDGSSDADGVKYYLDGSPVITTTKVDNLYKSILFKRRKEPGLQVGARWRGIGIKDAIVDDIVVFDRQLSRLEAIQISNKKLWGDILNRPWPSLSEKEQGWVIEYYLYNHHRDYQGLRKRWQQMQQMYAEIVDTVQELMVMEEMPTARPAYLLERGQYDAPAERVYPETPKFLGTMAEGDRRDRLGLAKWLFREQNPLTARVAVNRYWQQMFGRGLVSTPEDFGNQGALPSHPQLLDWLSTWFIEHEWDVKALVKLMVTSATYRQDSKASAALLQDDPENIYLARGPSQRLSAEMIRDQALYASGLLDGRIGGPSVFPYQPPDLWKVNGGQYPDPSIDHLYRRSLYTFWKRSVPHPTQSTFDAPDRSECLMRRQKTSTPLQALVLLNDPTYVEASRMLGQQIENFGWDRGVEVVFRKLTGRLPSPEELSVLQDLQQRELDKFTAQPSKMKGWLKTGLTGQAKSNTSLAAYTVVASTILNLDASIYKR